MVELIEQLEQRHYAKHRYDDELSSQHLDSYIDSLDRAKMFFTAADIAEFEKYRTAMDEQLHDGNLEAGFFIFNRYQQRLESRLEGLVANLPDQVEAMDFTVDETMPLKAEELDWAADMEELDDRWRKRVKNEVLSLKLADKAEDEITPTLQK
ncbi:MAG: peptidase S41, partial [Pseudomonadota bacterium]